MLDAVSITVLDRLREATDQGRLVWREDADGYFVADIGDEGQAVTIRRMFVEATNQIGADPYFVELKMPGWGTRFPIAGDSDGWKKMVAILQAAFPDHWEQPSAADALKFLDLLLP